jgi:4-amino-4-deoxy-L-arabinose transferase-like glycosyltransferase
MTEKITERNKALIVAAAFLLIFCSGMFLRILDLNDEVMLFDDAFTHEWALMPPDKTLQAAAGEMTPPLALMVERSWLKVAPAHSEFWLRLPMVILSGLSFFLLFALGRMIAGDKAALAGCFLFAFSPDMIDMARIARYPSVSIFLVLLLLIGLWKYIETAGFRYLCLFCVAMTLGLYTHYVFMLVAASVGIYVLFSTERRKRFFCMAGLLFSFVMFLPWINEFRGSAGGTVGMLPLPGILANLKTEDIILSVPRALQQFLLQKFPLRTFSPILTLVLFSCILYFLASALATLYKERKGLLLPAVLLLPLLFACALGILTHYPLYSFSRSTAGLAPVFFLLLAIGWLRIGKPALRVVSLLPFLFILGIGLHHYMQHRYTEKNTRAAVIQLAARQQPGDVMLASPNFCEAMTRFYNSSNMPVIGVTTPYNPLNYRENTAAGQTRVWDGRYFNKLKNQLKPYRRVWVFWCAGPYWWDHNGEFLRFMDSEFKNVFSYEFYFNNEGDEPTGLLKLYELNKEK